MQFPTDEELYKTIGCNIKKYRSAAHLTQSELAEAVDISLSYLSKIEAAGCNKSLSISVLNQIANTLNVDITKFFKEDFKSETQRSKSEN
ncbi:MAG: helix-turn-helix transcriptional regulator [Clostridiales bacterium]|nr:helix-turn-helix transcriptional regulator [Clostridiales bacterium]MDE7424351.1 helix-turn-helix transcriptional regulator [Lachnospiraceae bacterium]